MKKHLSKQIILSGNYWVLNKDLVAKLGLEPAFLLSSFADAEDILADDQGWFYQTTQTVEDITTLTRHKQNMALEVLKEHNLVWQENRDAPPKRYFKINYDALANLFVDTQHIETLNFSKSNVLESATNKEHTNKERIIKNNTIVDSKESTHLSKYDKVPYFNEFWEAYPKKVSKGQALAPFKRQVKNRETLDLIIEDIEFKLKHKIWEDKQFIPNASTYLNAERWLDEKFIPKPQYKTREPITKANRGGTFEHIKPD